MGVGLEKALCWTLPETAHVTRTKQTAEQEASGLRKRPYFMGEGIDTFGIDVSLFNFRDENTGRIRPNTCLIVDVVREGRNDALVIKVCYVLVQ